MSYTFNPTNFDSHGFPLRTADDREQAAIAGLPAFVRLLEFAEKADECEIKVGGSALSLAENQKYLVITVLSALQSNAETGVESATFEMMDKAILKDVLDLLNFYSVGASEFHSLLLMQSMENGGPRLHEITLCYRHYQSVCKANLEI